MEMGTQTAAAHSWIPSGAWSPSLRLDASLTPTQPAFLNTLPSMSSTVLALDLLLQEPLIDLRAASEIILSDVGATLQVLQLIADQHAASQDCFSSMAHCLASLEVHDWFDTISACTFRCDSEH